MIITVIEKENKGFFNLNILKAYPEANVRWDLEHFIKVIGHDYSKIFKLAISLPVEQEMMLVPHKTDNSEEDPIKNLINFLNNKYYYLCQKLPIMANDFSAFNIIKLDSDEYAAMIKIIGALKLKAFL